MRRSLLVLCSVVAFTASFAGYSQEKAAPQAPVAANEALKVFDRQPIVADDAVAQQLRAGTPGSTAVVDGTHGDVFLTSPAPFNVTGVLLKAQPSWPYVVAQSGASHAASGFAVYDPAVRELFRVQGDGRIGINTTSPQDGLHMWNRGGVSIENLLSDPAAGSVTTLGLSNRSAAGGLYTWKFFTAGAAGGYGVTPNGLDLYEYPNSATKPCCVLRIQIRPVSTPTPKVLVLGGDGYLGLGVYPSYPLDVAGNAHVSGNLIVDGNVAAKYQDVAEWVTSDADLAPGTVVVLGREHVNTVTAATEAFDTRVAGVVSAQPGLILGEAGASKEMVATTGRVRVRVDATRHAIRIGDLLVTSAKSGMAMKSTPIDVGGIAIHRPGTIIGKALEPLAGGEGEILVLLSLQ